MVGPDSLENRVVPFGSTAVDDDIIFISGSDSRIYTIDGYGHLRVRFSTETVQGTRVPILLKPEGFHGLLHPGVHFRRCVIIKIYTIHI